MSDLVFMCADSGAVVALTYTDARRPVPVRAVVFLASGETLRIDGGQAALAVRGRSALRLSASARPRTTGDARVPVGIELAFEPASQEVTPAPWIGGVTLAKGTGSLAVGSVIHRVEGSAWLGGGFAEPADFRARAVFQDGSALYVATGTPSPQPVAVLVRNTRIHATAVMDVTMRGAERGGPGRNVSWAAAGRSPAGAFAEIRDPRQSLTLTEPGRPPLSCAPFVFVRSGVTGLGLVERRATGDAPIPAADPADELPDPF